MKRKWAIVVGVGLALLAVLSALITVPNLTRRTEWKRTKAALQTLPLDRVREAARACAEERKLTGPTVPLWGLVRGGYLRTEDVRGLQGQDVSVSLTVDETKPQTILIRIRASDGSDTVLLPDGSVHRMVGR